MDLKIINARLMGKPGLWTVAIAHAKITHIVPHDQNLDDATQTIDAHHHLLIPGFVDAPLARRCGKRCG
jgi:cytosine/adenosine deaminase-related metal-dependent hydrolase